eukprot:gene19798-25740_t
MSTDQHVAMTLGLGIDENRSNVSKQTTSSNLYSESFEKSGHVKSNMHEHRWEKMFELLLQAESVIGTCKVPLSYEVTMPDGSVCKLGLWLGTQRQLYRKSNLRKDKFERLQALVDMGKLEWGEVKATSDDMRWNKTFDYLIKYGEANGHCNVPERFNITLDNGETIKLGRWLDRQRGHMRRNKVRPDRLQRLQILIDRGLLIGDTFAEDEKKWNYNFDALVSYGKEHGHCNVPHNYNVKLPNGSISKLGVWLSTQRHLQKKEGKLRADRASKLQELVDQGLLKWGDVQVGKDLKWELCYSALLQHDIEHGHENLSRSTDTILPDGTKIKLYKWLLKQINNHKCGKLKHDRFAKLQEYFKNNNLSWDVLNAVDSSIYSKLDSMDNKILENLALERVAHAMNNNQFIGLSLGTDVNLGMSHSDQDLEDIAELGEEEVDALINVANASHNVLDR